MQLNEILDENSVSSISKKTNIAEDNINALVSAEFEKIKRVKTMGFISIIEREYRADLSKLKEQAIEYYDQHTENEKVTLGIPMAKEKKGKSKWFMFIVPLLIIYVIWYAFNNFDQEKIKAMFPFSEDKLGELFMNGNQSSSEETIDIKELSIENMSSANNATVETSKINEVNKTY